MRGEYVKEEDLRSLFADYGEVESVLIPTERGTWKSRGFAFIEMEGDYEDTAIAELDGAEWMGRQLRVLKSKPRVEDRRLGKAKLID